MTLTIDLPDELASRLTALLPEEERWRFSVAAIADALAFREEEGDNCTTAVEQALADMDKGADYIPLKKFAANGMWKRIHLGCRRVNEQARRKPKCKIVHRLSRQPSMNYAMIPLSGRR